jgi:hypothetical protein
LPNKEISRSPVRENTEVQKTRQIKAELSSASKIYLKVPSLDSVQYRRAMALVEIFCEGKCEVIFYDNSSASYKKLASPRLELTQNVYKLLSDICGKENVIVK